MLFQWLHKIFVGNFLYDIHYSQIQSKLLHGGNYYNSTRSQSLIELHRGDNSKYVKPIYTFFNVGNDIKNIELILPISICSMIT